MQLTEKSMAEDSTSKSIPEINHQESADNDEEEKVEPVNSRHLLTSSSSSKTTRLLSRSPSPSVPRPASTAPPDRALNQKFHVAALSGNLSVLQELVTKARLPIDCRDKENSTALLLACARGHNSCAEYLLSNGADVNARRITGASSLYFAASYRHTRIVELLLKHKAIVDLSTFDGASPLHVASERGFADIVRLLLDNQANVNAKMNDGTTAIMLACQNGHLPVVEMLVATGQCDLSMQRLDGVTAIFLAIQNGHEPIFDNLIDKSENLQTIINLAREDGATPLFKACQKGYDSLVNKVLKFKPNLGLLKNGESCLHAATMFNHASIVRALLDNGADPLLNNWEGMTAVDLAKEAQIEDILDLLMKALAPKMSEHARQYLLHKSTRRSDADFDLDLVEHEERDEWKLYKSLKSAAGLERLEEEIEQTPIVPDHGSAAKGKHGAGRSTTSHKPHRYHTTTHS